MAPARGGEGSSAAKAPRLRKHQPAGCDSRFRDKEKRRIVEASGFESSLRDEEKRRGGEAAGCGSRLRDEQERRIGETSGREKRPRDEGKKSQGGEFSGCESRRRDEKRRRCLKASSPPIAQSRGPCSTSCDEDESAKVYAMVGEQMRKMLAVHAEKKRLVDEFNRSMSEEATLTVESRFGDINDGSIGSLKARKIAMMISESIVSLSSFSGGKRIRVCSGFVMRWNSNTERHLIITSATLVRSLNGDNVMVFDPVVKVLMPDGMIVDGSISLVDFHYNIAVVEVPSDMKIPDVSLANDIAVKGDVLALGRSYEAGDIMCSRGTMMYKSSTFGCSELFVSSCKISMAGVGGPLVDYNGCVLGINFYEKNQTPFLPMAIVSRILEHHQRFGKTILPWLGLKCSALETVPLRVLERIYRKFPDVDKGLYISNVAVGSPADVAGLCAGDVLVKCGGEDLSTTPQFVSRLLDTCKQLAETHHWENAGDYARESIDVEVVVKQDRDGSTKSKSMSADLLKECHYNRWPAPMPSYKARWINVTPW